jgi:hypothetical protein
LNYHDKVLLISFIAVELVQNLIASVTIPWNWVAEEQSPGDRPHQLRGRLQTTSANNSSLAVISRSVESGDSWSHIGNRIESLMIN